MPQLSQSSKKEPIRIFIPELCTCSPDAHTELAKKLTKDLKDFFNKKKKVTKVKLRDQQLIVDFSGDLKFGDIKQFLHENYPYTGIKELDPGQETAPLSLAEKFLAITRISAASLVVIAGLILPYVAGFIPGFFPLGWIIFAAVSLAVLIYAGFPTLQRAYNSLSFGRWADMDVVLIISSSITWLASLLMFAPNLGMESLFGESLMIILFRNISEIFESRTRRSLFPNQPIEEKLSGTDLFPEEFPCGDDPRCLENKNVKELIKGRYLYYRLGANEFARVAGTIEEIEEGDYVDACTSIKDGEIKPMRLVKGNSLEVGYSIDRNAIIKVDPEKLKNQNNLFEDLEQSLQQKKSRQSSLERLLATVAKYYVPLLLIFAVIFFFAVFKFSLPAAILGTICILVSTCPCSLGMIIPIGFEIAKAKARAYGLEFEQPAMLSDASKIKQIYLDLVGTITEGAPTLSKKNIKILKDDFNHDKMIAMIAQLESGVHHPIAQCCRNYAKKNKLESNVVLLYKVSERYGITAIIGEDKVGFGGSKLMDQIGIVIDEKIKSEEESHKKQGYQFLYLAIAGKLAGYVIVKYEIRKEAKEVIESWTNQNMEVFILTGSENEFARNMAAQLGCDQSGKRLIPDSNIKADLSKEDKYIFVNELPHKDEVLYVGDGLNDSKVFTTAGTGVAILNGHPGDRLLENLAPVSAAGKNPLYQVMQLINIAKQYDNFTKAGFGVFLAYNFFAISMVVVGVLARFIPALGFALILSNPGVAALFVLIELALITSLFLIYKFSKVTDPLSTYNGKDHHIGHAPGAHDHSHDKGPSLITEKVVSLDNVDDQSSANEEKPHCGDCCGHKHHHGEHGVKQSKVANIHGTFFGDTTVGEKLPAQKQEHAVEKENPSRHLGNMYGCFSL